MNEYSESAITTADQLLGLSYQQLDDLFGASPAGPIPVGNSEGKALFAPGTIIGGVASALIWLFVWQGKVFDAEKGELRNKLSPFGVKGVVAKVYHGESWFDGKECIVLDYSKTSTIARGVRDELRMVSPGVYLGIVFMEKKKLLHFALNTF